MTYLSDCPLWIKIPILEFCIHSTILINPGSLFKYFNRSRMTVPKDSFLIPVQLLNKDRNLVLCIFKFLIQNLNSFIIFILIDT